MPHKVKVIFQEGCVTFRCLNNTSIYVELASNGMTLHMSARTGPVIAVGGSEGISPSDIKRAFDQTGAIWDETEFDSMLQSLHYYGLIDLHRV